MSSQSGLLILPEFFNAVASMSQIDEIDWGLACRHAERWKLSVADALLDLRFVDESTLACALAATHGLKFLPAAELVCEFGEIDFETFQDFLSAGAVPLENDRLAICNPYDDLRGILGTRMCQREWIVTERSAVFEVLRKQEFVGWMEGTRE